METPNTAMILAAGFGRRMGTLTQGRPKPLLEVSGRAIIDRVLDQVAAAGIGRAVVNLHHEAELLRRHLAPRTQPALAFSDESDGLLDTGGGVAKALPLLGEGPFFVVNGDVMWIDTMGQALHGLAARFDAEQMDALLLLQPTVSAVGYGGVGDFDMAAGGQLSRRLEIDVAPFVHTGIQILHPDLFRDCAPGPFSLNRIYDKAAETGRLFGLRHEGHWMELNRPEGLAAAERVLIG